MKEMANQMSLFDIESEQKLDAQTDLLQVVKSTFVTNERLNWNQLFEGFDEIYAITYSSGIDFVAKVMEKFSYGEIIFGCEKVIGDDFATIMAVQTVLLETIAKRKSAKFLADLVEQKSLKLFVSRDLKSHEKIFCLRAADGRTRVIMGSANMSASAFMGFQRENITYYDDRSAYDWYKGRFDEFKELCADNVNHETLLATQEESDHLRDEIEEVPIAQTIVTKKALFLDITEDEEESELVASVEGLEAELKPMLPKPKKEKGKNLLDAEHIRNLKSRNREHREEKKVKQKKLPKLHLDYDVHTVQFNGKPCNMNPAEDEIRNDVNYLFSFMDGYSIFCGDVDDAQKDYFSFMNWFFASPFMPYLRQVGSSTNYDVFPFPVNGIVYGDSNGGKTTFLKLLSKLMCNQRIPVCSTGDYTASNIEDLKRGYEGVPIVVDDVDKTQFQNHCGKIIKDDNWGIREHWLNYPSVAVTTNKIPSLESAISKRCIGCRIGIKIGKEDGAKNIKRINDSMKNVTGSFYYEYVRRMFPRVEELAENMKIGEQDYFPDIFKISSETICEIIRDLNLELPGYVRELSYGDYFGEKVVGKNAINKILNAWENERTQFTIDRKKNKLTYMVPENSNTYELKYIYEELPPELDAKHASRTLTMKLSEAERFFGIKFKKKIFEK